MRNSYRQSRSGIANKWIWLLVVGIVILFVFRYFFTKEESTRSKEGISISGSGQFVIIDSTGKKHDISEGDVLTESDKVLSILTGVGILHTGSGEAWLDKKTEITYLGTTDNKQRYSLSQGRIWVESKQEIEIQLKHIKGVLSSDTVALIEQQPIYSIIYILKGTARIEAPGGRTTTLGALKRIMVSQSNLADPGATLSSLAGDIDDSIKQNAFFLARGGMELVDEIETSLIASGTLATGSFMPISSTGSISPLGKYISITSPQDGSKINGATFRVGGVITSPVVNSITINDLNVNITKTGAFISDVISFTNSDIDIVYKAYDEGKNLLERGLITVYSDTKSGTEKLVPTTFPTNDKDFRFVSPNENPYKTTQSAITVSGVVPKGAVEYITVNGYRLKKFTPYSSSWYYYANTVYQTMKEGFNLYEIRFYGQNNTLLSSQLFTIIKEGGTVSGE